MSAREQARLRAIIEPVVRAMDCELWGIEYSARARRSVLRIFIDADKGIDLDDCERVSRQVSAVLDVEDPVPGEYMLEVSSPGMDRRLFTLDQCRDYVGERVRAKLFAAIPGRKKFTGQLVAVEDDELVIRTDDDSENDVFVPFESVDKVNVVPGFEKVGAKSNR